MNATRYDYIFLGAGCASLSIIMRMIDAKEFSDKRILIIDKEPKNKNDRTWCFWEKEENYFENIIYRKWNKLNVETGFESIPLQADNYEYKMIRGADFYKYCFDKIKDQNNIEIFYGNISFSSKKDAPTILVDNELLQVRKDAFIFNSIYLSGKKQPGKFYLLQHFKGWVIETGEDHFNIEQATLMDFRTGQENGATFVYTLPLSRSQALVEYTVFSKSILPEEDYRNGLASYIRDFLSVTDYTVREEEFGVIPMSNANFPFFKNDMYYTGTAGGQTKASTGYTFRFIQKQAEEIVAQLRDRKSRLTPTSVSKRFLFYDSTLLHILSNNLLDGKTIFTRLFRKNKAAEIFKFLDNESTLGEEMRLLNSLPKIIFIKAGWKEFIKLMAVRFKQ
ncbi:MAG TPA: lycopene cyclase family protein [Chitinophagaceae bacterium]|nr:lycopene cyclase family protein [Chitinophagaceae bacterium]